MEGIIVFIVVAFLLDLAALLWGADSRDDIESREWHRRKAWNSRSVARRLL